MRALAEYYRVDSEFTDSIAKRECGEMLGQFMSMFRTGRVFRGRTDGDHFGQYLHGRIHIDPKYLDGAVAGIGTSLQEVGVTAVHEAGHALGKRHTLPDFDAQGRDIYTDPYFNRLNPGPNSCVKR